MWVTERAIIHGEMMVSVRGAGKPGTSEGGRLPRAAEHGCSAALCILVWCVLSLLGVDAVHGCAGKCLRSNRTTFYIVGMVPFGGFVSSYGPALKHYLDNEVGIKYEPRITFDIRQDNLQVAQTFTCPPTHLHAKRRARAPTHVAASIYTLAPQNTGRRESETDKKTYTHITPHTHTHMDTRMHARARAHTHKRRCKGKGVCVIAQLKESCPAEHSALARTHQLNPKPNIPNPNT